MSLRSLLPIGRSFSPHDHRLGRYRPADPGTLPDFSDVPARSGREGGLEPSSANPEPTPDAAGTPTSTANAPLRSATEPRPTFARTAALTSSRSQPARRLPPSGRRLPLWLENLLMTLFGPGNRRRLSDSVQTEMDFRAVRVARNDLTASDVEVVPIRTPPAETSLSPDCRKRVLRLWFDQGSQRLRRWGSSIF
ncbi:MAG: hypothetical protein IT580_03710 [Verrucomicrobiales bacterium]|nr:hypothetical protein [Verrucomicrobiales bacterium]